MDTHLDLTLGTFADPAALAIVFGGTLTALVLRTSARDLARAATALAVLPRRAFSADALLTQIDAFTRISARHGVIQLDRSVVRDADVGAAIAAIVDGADAATVTRRLDEARIARGERHRAAIDFWNAATEIFPAMGMVGTLIGLVRLFATMTDPKAIGASMAVAVLATLYGALAANLIAAPVAARLRRRARTEYIERGRLAAPLAELAAREAPRRRPLDRERAA